MRETSRGEDKKLHVNNKLGNQTVFSSINYGTDSSTEGRMIIQALYKSTERGLGNGETPIFPIQIFKVKEGISYSDEDYAYAMNNIEDALAGKLKYKTPNFDLFIRACVVSSKRLFPNFLFLDASFNKNDKWDINDPNRYLSEVATMGCRTRIFSDRFGDTTSISRGNLSFTTMNLVRLAILSKQEANAKGLDDVNDLKAIFFNKIKETSDLIANQLIERYQFQCTAKAKQFPFLMGQGLWIKGDTLSPNQKVKEVLRHGTLSIGFIGLAEALIMLIGKHHGESEEAQKLGLETVKYMRELTDKYSDTYNLNFSLFATPAEGLSGRFTAIDKKKFGIIPNVTDKEFYTNSFHLPVYYHVNALKKIELEAPYHVLTNAGHISYIEMDAEAKKNIPAFMKLVKHMKDKDMGYVSINHPIDRCNNCGLETAIEHECPQCGETVRIDRIRRITGYLVGTLDRWNSYKQAEEKMRVKHVTKDNI